MRRLRWSMRSGASGVACLDASFAVSGMRAREGRLSSALSMIAPSVNVLRRTRRKPSTIRGAAPDVVIGQSTAVRAGARPYRRRRTGSVLSPAVCNSTELGDALLIRGRILTLDISGPHAYHLIDGTIGSFRDLLAGDNISSIEVTSDLLRLSRFTKIFWRPGEFPSRFGTKVLED